MITQKLLTKKSIPIRKLFYENTIPYQSTPVKPGQINQFSIISPLLSVRKISAPALSNFFNTRRDGWP